MDLLTTENIRTVFKEFVNSPTYNATSIYNALTKNYEEKSGEFDDLEKHKEICAGHKEIFKVGYDACTADSGGWYHTKSRHYDDNCLRKHRIYINPASKNRLTFVRKLIEQSLEERVDFYFKFSRWEERSDGIVIYATDDQLGQYAKVLKNVEEKYPDLIEGCGKTPLSTSTKEWFGYGPNEKSSTTGSLSEKTAKVIRQNITKSLLSSRQIFNIEQMEQSNAIMALYKQCVDKHASDIKDEAFRINPPPELKQSFINHSQEILAFCMNRNISDEEIEQDKSLMVIKGQLEITPSCISAMLASQKPNWTSKEEKDYFYKNLLQNCQTDLQTKKLDVKIPDVLQNYKLTNEEQKEENIKKIIYDVADIVGVKDENKRNDKIQQLLSMKTEDAIDSLLIAFGKNINSGKIQKDDAIEIIQNNMTKLIPEKYSTYQDFVERLEWIKSMNMEYMEMPLTENHKMVLNIFDGINSVLGKDFDYFHTGGIMAYVASDKPLERYHGDLDIFINENQLPQLKKILDDNQDFKIVSNLNVKGNNGHEFSIKYKNLPIDIGLFLFDRTQDDEVILKSYYQDENSNDLVVDEQYLSKEYSDLAFPKDNYKTHNNIPYSVQSLEAIYLSKKGASREKDKHDISIIENIVDMTLVDQMEQESQKIQKKSNIGAHESIVASLDKAITEESVEKQVEGLKL